MIIVKKIDTSYRLLKISMNELEAFCNQAIKDMNVTDSDIPEHVKEILQEKYRVFLDENTLFKSGNFKKIEIYGMGWILEHQLKDPLFAVCLDEAMHIDANDEVKNYYENAPETEECDASSDSSDEEEEVHSEVYTMGLMLKYHIKNQNINIDQKVKDYYENILKK